MSPGCALLPARGTLQCVQQISAVYMEKEVPVCVSVLLCCAWLQPGTALLAVLLLVEYFNISRVETAQLELQYKSLCNCTVETVFPKLLASFRS